MKVTKLSISNFMRLHAVEIEPGEEHTIVISGKNGEGKSSLLDAIAVALAGPKAARKLVEPIHKGKKRAQIIVETEDYVITRKWSSSTAATGTLTVKDRTERLYSTPQRFLDSIIGKLTFSPLDFANAAAKEQREMLLSVLDLPIDLEQLDGQRKGLYETRRDANRERDRLGTQLEGMEKPEEGLPEAEISVTALVTDLQKAEKVRAAHDNAMAEVAEGEMKTLEWLEETERLLNCLRELEREIEAGKKNLTDYVEPDFAGLQRSIAGAEAYNAKIRAAKQYAEVADEWKEARKTANGLDSDIIDIDDKKKQALDEAKLPVAGLGITEEGITYNDIPFEQAADSEKLRVSIAIGMALNPKVRVLTVNNASLLDPESMKIVEEMAKEHDFQVWLEVVADATEGVGICIEDGSIADNGDAGKIIPSDDMIANTNLGLDAGGHVPTKPGNGELFTDETAEVGKAKT